MMLNTVLLVFFNLWLTDNLVGADKLNIEVLYESLCPDSYSFIRGQLQPDFKELSPYVNLKFVPFGKAFSENNTTFTCQHGAPECRGNRIMSCGLKLLNTQEQQVEYVSCFMEVYRTSRNNGEMCASRSGIDQSKINECFNSVEGTHLQLLAEVETKKYSPRFIPTIVYNGVFDQRLQDRSLSDFRNVVCEIIQKDHPGVCQSSTKTVNYIYL